MTAFSTPSAAEVKGPGAVSETELLGYRLARLSLEEAAQWAVRQCFAGGKPKLLVTLNPEIIIGAQSDPALRAALTAADLSVADGVGVLWAARRLGSALPGRVPGVELVPRILELGGQNLSVFYLGSKPGVAQRAADAAARRYGTSVAGVQHGYFQRPEETPEMVSRIRASGAQLLLAGLGEGQERFLHEHRSDLGTPVMIGVGGTLDVLSGKVKRTPLWTRQLGLEWAYRVGTDRNRWHRFPRLVQFVRLVLQSQRDKSKDV